MLRKVQNEKNDFWNKLNSKNNAGCSIVDREFKKCICLTSETRIIGLDNHCKLTANLLYHNG